MIFWFYFILWTLGLAVGSFLNVLALRFKPEEGKLWSQIYGRSLCRHCGKTLRWYELIPLISFLIQLGRCRTCGARLTFQYPLVEFLGGLLPVLVVSRLWPSHPLLSPPYFVMLLWTLAFWLLLLMSIIDFYHRLIPDSLNVLIAVLGIILLSYRHFGGTGWSFQIGGGSALGSYALLFPGGSSYPLNALLGAVFGVLFLGVLFVISRGRGMGLGDVKLAAALGLFMGWPDIFLALLLAFISGAALSLLLILLKRKTLKDYVPFGPFIAGGAFLTFFFGYQMLDFYFRFFNWLLPF